MAERTITVTHEGVTYYGHIATIESTHLGYEHHGIFTAALNLKWEHSGISVGDYCLDEPDEDKRDRHGTAFGHDHIIQLMRVVGVSTWEALKGKRVIVLFETEHSWGSMAKGLANVDEDRVFIPKAHAEMWLKTKTAVTP